MNVKLLIKMTPKQKEWDSNPARFKLLKVGRRGMKTRYLAKFLATQALLRVGKHWYVTRTLGLAREEFFPVLVALLPRDLVRKIDDRLLSVWLTNGSVISCKSGEKEDNLRGRSLESLVMDEAAFLRPNLWSAILRPQLGISMGPAVIASSPKKGWFTQLYNDVVRNPGKFKDFAAFHGTLYDNPYMSAQEIEDIKATTAPNTWLQEYMAEEISEEGQVYAEFSSRNIYDPREKFKDVKTFAVVRGLDHGTADNTACAFIGISPEGYLVIFDEYAAPGSDYARHADAIHGKSTGLNVKANILDRSAFRDIGTGVSMAKLYADEGIRCQESERDVSASIEIMRRFINGDGNTPWLYVSSRCPKTIEAFQSWENGDHEPDIAAASRYGVVGAVARKLTRLHDAVPNFKHTQKAYSEEEAKVLLGQHARIVPTKRAANWSWDGVNGVPLG